MTDSDNPATEAGRRHSAWWAMHGDPLLTAEHDSDILAIEAEATAGHRHHACTHIQAELLTLREAAAGPRSEGLREALEQVDALPRWDKRSVPGGFYVKLADVRTALSAASSSESEP